DCLRERSIVYRLVVKCAVRLDVCDTRTKAVRDFAENTDLFKSEIGNRFKWHFEFETPEVVAIRVTGMRTNRDVRAESLLNRDPHRFLVPRMTSTRDIRGRQ